MLALPKWLATPLYTHKYLESDLIKYCHVIFIHSLSQPLIVRSHSKVHWSRGNPKEIPTQASRVSNYSYFPWFNRQNTRRPATDSQNCMYSITWSLSQRYMYSITWRLLQTASILLHGVWCKNTRYSIPIITLIGVSPDGLSLFDKLCHPRASPRVTLLFSGRQTVGSHSNKGDNCIRSYACLDLHF